MQPMLGETSSNNNNKNNSNTERESIHPVKVTKWFGTTEASWIWFNTTDCVGMTFGLIVLMLMGFSFSTLYMLYANNLMANIHFGIIAFFFVLSLWAHLATMCGDPGSIPWNAHPTSKDRRSGMKMSICGHCDSYKPPNAHHCRVSKRCISRMDHFCPWTNNSIGAQNQKNFLLFLVYTGIAGAYMYVLCAILLLDDSITIQPLLGMVRVVVFVLVFSMLFTSAMIFNQVYGIQTGFGTIDRMKMKSSEVLKNQKSTPILHVLGKFSWRWFLPVAVLHESPDDVFRYTQKNYRYGKAI